MIKRPVPFERMAFVCTFQRPDGHPKPCCGARGGADLRAKLKEMVAERGLLAQVKVFQSGCLGGCEFGPVIMTMPDGQMHFQVGEEDLGAIADSLCEGVTPPAGL